MTEPTRKLIKTRKFWGVLFLLSFGFSLCLCTPLSPAPWLDKIISSPAAPEPIRSFNGSEILLFRQPIGYLSFAGLFGFVGSCLVSMIALFGFVFITVVDWRTEVRTVRQSSLELQKMQIELEKQRLELEKKRLALEMQRQRIEEQAEEKDSSQNQS